MSNNVWVIGTSMTRFGRFPEKDLLDLAVEATTGALKDADLDLGQINLLALGNVYETNSHHGQRLQNQMGQTGIPVYNVVNACATGATAVRVAIMSILAGETDIGLAVGVEQMGKMGLLGGGKKRDEKKVYTPKGRYGSVVKTEGLLGHQHDAGRLRPGRHRVRAQARGDADSVREGRAQEPPALDAEPAGPVPEGVQPRGDPRGRDHRLAEHAADVLPDRRRRGRGDPVLGRQARDPRPGRPPPRGQGVGVDPDLRPLRGRRAGAGRHQHPDPERRRRRPTRRRASDRRTSIWSSCTTASPPPSCSTTTISGSASRARPGSSSTPARPTATAGSR